MTNWSFGVFFLILSEARFSEVFFVKGHFYEKFQSLILTKTRFVRGRFDKSPYCQMWFGKTTLSQKIFWENLLCQRPFFY